MRLVQFFSREGLRAVGMPDEAGRRLKVLEGVERIYDLALLALQQGQSLVLAAEERVGAASEDYDGVVAERRLLPPLDHPDPAHCLVSGTGLTHLGSADRSEEHTSELQSLMRSSYAVFCLKNKKIHRIRYVQHKS